MATDYIILFVTCSSKKEAGKIAKTLLSEKLVACANLIHSVDSMFRWKGRIERAREVLIMLKARARDFRSIEKAVRRIHSYDVPEIIAIPIVAGSKEYLNWLRDNIH